MCLTCSPLALMRCVTLEGESVAAKGLLDCCARIFRVLRVVYRGGMEGLRVRDRELGATFMSSDTN